MRTQNGSMGAGVDEYVSGDSSEMHVGSVMRVDAFRYNLCRLSARTLERWRRKEQVRIAREVEMMGREEEESKVC